MGAFLSSFKFILENMLILYFHIFQGGLEGWNAIFQVSVYVTIVTVSVYYHG